MGKDTITQNAIIRKIADIKSRIYCDPDVKCSLSGVWHQLTLYGEIEEEEAMESLLFLEAKAIDKFIRFLADKLKANGAKTSVCLEASVLQKKRINGEISRKELVEQLKGLLKRVQERLISETEPRE